MRSQPNWRAMLRHCRRFSSAQSLRCQRRSVALHVVALLLLALPLSAADDIITRTKITPDSVWVGQRMTLQIDVLGKDGWAQITNLEALDIPNCYLLPAGNDRVRLQEKIEGADYSGQRYELSLYPQRDGIIQIPKMSLPIRVQTWGANSGTSERVAQTQANSIEAKLPSGVKNVHSFVASPKFTAAQTWSSEADNFTVGDALKRSIRLEATDLPAMLLPTISAPELSLLSSYPETPQLNDTTELGPPTGSRDETITYVFEANGTVELPTYIFQWWDTTNETLQTITLPGRSVQLSGGSTTTSPSAGQALKNNRSSRSKYAIVFFTLLSAPLALWLIKRSRANPNNTGSTEKHLFQQLTKQQHSNSAYLQQTLTWVDTLTASRLTLSEFLQEFSDPQTQAIAALLLRDPTHTTELTALKTGLRNARNRYLKAQAKQSRIQSADHQLPPLNG